MVQFTPSILCGGWGHCTVLRSGSRNLHLSQGTRHGESMLKSVTTRQTNLMEPRFLALILPGFGGLLALLHLYGGLFPSGINWGAHVFAFFPPAVTLGAPLFMLLALVPGVQRVILTFLEKVFRDFSNSLERGELCSLWRS